MTEHDQDPPSDQEEDQMESEDPIVAPSDEETADDSVANDQEFLVNQLQLARAELENFRRRTQMERLVLRQRIVADVFKTFLPVLDGLTAALKADAGESEPAGIRDGLQLIAGKADEILKELGIESVAAVGEDFDPEVHEAILQVDQPGSRNGEIVEEIDRGYRCGDQLIRASRVVVARTGETSQGA
ncbi:MAG: nucleotide exchange factor GrpE [Planctomycetes bacterium]|nr:nucleotide exchange factor GrpE [Planctomycetota bacterium]MAW77058.1 nucleotide exchange factor GrpE [Planctomycetota bacterium]